MTLEQAVGEQLRQLREAEGIRQEDLAAAARFYGARWTRATIAAIELGRKKPSLGDLALLLLALKDCLKRGKRLTLRDLVPHDEDDKRSVTLADDAELPLRIGWAILFEADPPVAARPPQADPRALEAAGDAEVKAARALRVSPEAIVKAAHQRWGHGLTARRDRLVFIRTGALLKADPAEATKVTWPRRLQAIRGHVTRELLEELRPLLKGAGKKRGTRTR